MQVTAKPISVMLVDDHQIILWGLAKLINGQSQKMKVVGTASNCEEAIEKTKQLVPDIVVLDLDLAGQSALNIIPSLLSNSVSRALILTGEMHQEKLDLAILAGARGVLRKDAPADQILEAIEKMHQGELWLDRATVGRVFAEFMDPKRGVKVDPEAERRATLTAKERKVIHTVVAANGASNRAVAGRLFITEHTLRNHLTSIYQKLDVSNRLELYVYAVKHQLDKPLS